MKPKHQNTLIDFPSVLPEMVTRVKQNERIVKGFVVAGMADTKFKNYHNFSRMLVTCCRSPSRGEYQTCYSSFIELFHAFVRAG